jgi:hypothetical protein
VKPFAALHAVQSWPSKRVIVVAAGDTVAWNALLSAVAMTPAGRRVLTEIEVLLAGTFHSVV